MAVIKIVVGLVLVSGLGLGAWAYGAPLAARLDGAGRDLLGMAKTEPPTAPIPDEPTDPNVVTINAAMQRKLGVATARAETRRIVKIVRVPGMVAFDERRVTHLKPRTQGRVLTLAVQPGDPVKAGDTLATLDASGVLDARNGLAASRASLGEAKAGETVADAALKRGIDLIKNGGIPQSEVDKRQVDVAKAHAAVLSAQAQVDLFTAQYERLAPTPGNTSSGSAIVSPIAGVVTSAALTLGEVVDSNRDAFTVADPSQVLVLANLYGHDTDIVKAGSQALVEAPLSGTPRFSGTVRSVNAALDMATSTAPARIEIANPSGALKANMLVSVEIEADLGRDGVTLPAAAMQQTEEGPIAFVRTSEDQFERRALTLGLQRGDWVEVRSGVTEGETVATEGSFALKAMLLRSLLGSTD